MNTPDKSGSFKVIIVGESFVGKTSIIKCLTENDFRINEQNTVNASYNDVIIPTSHGPAQLAIWDTAGTERFQSLIPSYTRNADAVVIVMSMSDADSFGRGKEWLDCALKPLSYVPQLMVLVNKSDLDPVIKLSDVKEWAEEKGMLYFETSAKTGYQVSESFQSLAEELVKNAQKGNSTYLESTEGISLNSINDTSKSCC
ncbi:ras-related protein Rab-5B-like [Histomonas meleagridis]|uniref:ras-related protein Rab-5B-like n=1 Tax=Histomonas meleagridis TaxID=135588 RepID=UPI003559AC0A|nr:ras-related protein Rab-5B-like [Histomonas meleagridis]KAH0799141.1 ras-related protein Rab-5B-like [Histomonas meleagridis]